MLSKSVIKDLKKTGLKITTPRREILQSLSSSPSSVQEIAHVLKERGFSADLVTIYRTLELFNDLGIVRKTQFEDKIARFELTAGQKHHHHIVCIKCGLAKDVVVDEKVLTEQIAKQSRFKLERHALEFFGFCNKCQ